MSHSDTADVFGTGPIRHRVLQAWEASPSRFREDANAEEDQALGGYRDRLVVELAQNAADAATGAGVPGRLRLTLRGGVLEAANNGAPLDEAGVEALSTLRASAKRGETGTTGRFGVGFAAVVAVTDEPCIASRAGGVAWSAARTRELVAAIPPLHAELEQRGGHVPVLRLPFSLGESPLGEGSLAAGPEIPDEFDTVVRLPLRDPDAVALVRRLLDETGPALMLALPALTEVTIDLDGSPRILSALSQPGAVTINGTTWRTIETSGEIPASLLADRPVEERGRPFWQVRWAIPVTEDRVAGLLDDAAAGLPDGVPQVVHAPTPSDEPLGLNALLLTSFPLAPDRRHVAPGPLTDFLVVRAAEAYVALLRELPVDPRLLDLVPGPVAKGELDAKISREILARIPETPLLPVVDHGGGGRDPAAGAGRDLR